MDKQNKQDRKPKMPDPSQTTCLNGIGKMAVSRRVCGEESGGELVRG